MTRRTTEQSNGSCPGRFSRLRVVAWPLALVICLGSGVPVSAQGVSFGRNPDARVNSVTGIRLPEGFEASVFHEGVGRARHIVVRDNGDVYVALRQPNQGGGIAALRDNDRDGRADRTEYFGDHVGTGIGIRGDFLYFSSDRAIYRYRLPKDDLVPENGAQTVVDGFPEQGSHAAKAFAFDDADHLFVNVGAPSNACQKQDRTPGSPGMQPCPLLERHAGIWRFDADRTGQSFADGERFLTGIRNVVALGWNPMTKQLYFVQHGRDQLHDLYPEYFSAQQSAELPGEEFHVAKEGANYGWPYTYWDPGAGQRMQAPEYGGDGKTPAKPDAYQAPLMAFPGHWAPNDLLFYTGRQFPQPFRGGAFIAFHGSWNRAPLPQRGYNVVFAPFRDGAPVGKWYVFADGFKGAEIIEASSNAAHRPMGLAQGPDGSLYISDSVEGRIWRVTYEGRGRE